MSRLFSQDAQVYQQNKNTIALTELYAAKEAAAKALSSGFQMFSPYEIEILYSGFDVPSIIFHRKALDVLKNKAKKQQQSRWK